jgi:hypothetical protein
VLSIANENHLLGALILSEVNQIKVRGPSKAINGYFSHPNEELLASLIIDARETPAGLRPSESSLGLNIEVLSLSVFALEQWHHCQAEVYLIWKISEQLLTFEVSVVFSWSRIVGELIFISLLNCRLNLLDTIFLGNLQVSHKLVKGTGCGRHLHNLSHLHKLVGAIVMRWRGLEPHVRFTYKEGKRFPKITYTQGSILLVSLLEWDCLINIVELHFETCR